MTKLVPYKKYQNKNKQNRADEKREKNGKCTKWYMWSFNITLGYNLLYPIMSDNPQIT